MYVRAVKDGNARPFNVDQVKPYYPPEDTAHAFVESLRERFCEYGNPHDYLGSVCLTEIINGKDPRSQSPEMTAAKRAEIAGLLACGTFKVILRKEIPPAGNVLPGRFVLAIKSTEDGEIKIKARCVIGGHRTDSST